jgi:hypothetical protein
MDAKAQEIQGGFKWLLFAGTAAVLLSLFLFYVDDVVMRGAPERDKEHAAQMAELRKAQASLPARVTDDRQTLPLNIEKDHASSTADTSHDSAGGDHAHHGH